MTAEERKSILSIALHAAFADGLKHEREREEIRSIALSLAGEAGSAELAPTYQDVLLKRVRIETAAAALTDPSMRQLAYEMAVCVCDADGRQSEAERRFLADLKGLLQLDPGDAVAVERDADAIVELTESAAPVMATGALPISLSSSGNARGFRALWHRRHHEPLYCRLGVRRGGHQYVLQTRLGILCGSRQRDHRI